VILLLAPFPRSPLCIQTLRSSSDSAAKARKKKEKLTETQMKENLKEVQKIKLVNMLVVSHAP
jgi:hypothetical protein